MKHRILAVFPFSIVISDPNSLQRIRFGDVSQLILNEASAEYEGENYLGFTVVKEPVNARTLRS